MKKRTSVRFFYARSKCASGLIFGTINLPQEEFPGVSAR